MLVGSLPIAEIGNNGKDSIGHPGGQHRWRSCIDGKRGRHRLQHDVDKTQG